MTEKPTFPQMEHFFRLVAEGQITSQNFQEFLQNREILRADRNLKVAVRFYGLAFSLGQQFRDLMELLPDGSFRVNEETILEKIAATSVEVERSVMALVRETLCLNDKEDSEAFERASYGED